MSIAKTLPMKFKAMHYALLAFITQSDEFPAELKVALIEKLPVHDSIENQVLFYEKLVDFKTVEKDIVKPMMKKKKQQETEASKPVKEKKIKAPKVKTVPVASDPATVPVPVPSLISAPTVSDVSVVPTVDQTEKPKKKRVVKKKTEPLNPPEQEEEKEEMSLTDEMKEEPYQPVTLSEPVTAAAAAVATTDKVLKKTDEKVVKKVPKADKVPKAEKVAKAEKVPKAVKIPKTEKVPKNEQPAPKPASAIPNDDDQEIENWLIIRDGVKYWTTDEFEQNGEVYEYCIDSEGDGCAGNVAIGHLKDGILSLNGCL